LKSARSPLHPDALTIADLTEGQIIVCVRFSGEQPMNLMDESNKKGLRVIAVNDDHVIVESRWLPGSPYELDAQEHGLAHNESRAWSSTYCTLSEESAQEIAATQRAAFKPSINRGAMALHQLQPLG